MLVLPASLRLALQPLIKIELTNVPRERIRHGKVYRPAKPKPGGAYPRMSDRDSPTNMERQGVYLLYEMSYYIMYHNENNTTIILILYCLYMIDTSAHAW